jgi:hypothetical protein
MHRHISLEAFEFHWRMTELHNCEINFEIRHYVAAYFHTTMRALSAYVEAQMCKADKTDPKFPGNSSGVDIDRWIELERKLYELDRSYINTCIHRPTLGEVLEMLGAWEGALEDSQIFNRDFNHFYESSFYQSEFRLGRMIELMEKFWDRRMGTRFKTVREWDAFVRKQMGRPRMRCV